MTKFEQYVVAALRIARPAEPYGNGLAWICDVRAACSHLMTHGLVDEILIRLQERCVVTLRRADMVEGVSELVNASELRCLTETWHYAGLVEEAE